MLAILILQFTTLNPILGMLSFSISLALGPVALVSSIPVILPLSLVGTGMGLVKSGTNVGASLMDIITGLLQDRDPNKGYRGVMLFFSSIGILSVLCGVTLFVLDRTIYNNTLDARKSTDVNSGSKRLLLTKKLKINYLYGGIYAGLVILSWVLFFRFVLF